MKSKAKTNESRKKVRTRHSIQSIHCYSWYFLKYSKFLPGTRLTAEGKVIWVKVIHFWHETRRLNWSQKSTVQKMYKRKIYSISFHIWHERLRYLDQMCLSRLSESNCFKYTTNIWHTWQSFKTTDMEDWDIWQLYDKHRMIS